MLLISHFSRVRLCVTPWTAAYQAPLPIGFSRQEYWSGVPLPSPSVPLGLLYLLGNTLSHGFFSFYFLSSQPSLFITSFHPGSATVLPLTQIACSYLSFSSVSWINTSQFVVHLCSTSRIPKWLFLIILFSFVIALRGEDLSCSLLCHSKVLHPSLSNTINHSVLANLFVIDLWNPFPSLYLHYLLLVPATITS